MFISAIIKFNIIPLSVGINKYGTDGSLTYLSPLCRMNLGN